MGYRSEVKIATTREGYDQMCERVDALSEGSGTSPLMGSCRKPDFFEAVSYTHLDVYKRQVNGRRLDRPADSAAQSLQARPPAVCYNRVQRSGSTRARTS